MNMSLEEYMQDRDGAYEEAKEKAFEEFINNLTKGYMSRTDIDEWSINGIGDYIEGENFEFPEAYDWYAKEYNDEIDAWADAMYEQQRDKDMGL